MPSDSPREVRLTRRRQLSALVHRRAWALKPIAIVVVVVVLLAGTAMGYSATSAGTYGREVVVALIGAALTVAGSLLVAVVAFRSELRRLREHDVVLANGVDSWERSALRVGAMEVPDIVVVASGRQGHEWTEHAGVEWQPMRSSPRPRDALLDQVRAERLDEVVEAARAGSIVLTDGACVDLAAARVELRRTEDGRRRPVYLLEPAPATYFDFLCSGADLDGITLKAGERAGMPLREAWRPVVRSIEDVGQLPFLAKLGCGAAVVTVDDHLVLGVRGRTFIAGQQLADPLGRKLVHVVAEGVLPDDVDPRGRLDPRRTAARGLQEELLIGGSSFAIGHVLDMASTGFFFDQLRMQPCFAHLARVSLTWDELQTVVPAAADFWEVESLVSMPFDIGQAPLRNLLLGRDPRIVLASNHAAAVLWFACLYEFGFDLMRDELSLAAPARARRRSR